MPARDSRPARLVRIEGLPITAVLLILVALFMLVAPEVFPGLRAQAERGKSDQGLYDTLVAAGLQVDYIEISPEVDHDSSLAVPIISAYLLKHPDLKAIGTQHGNVTAFIAKALKDAGKKPGESHDRWPEEGLCQRHPRPAALPAGVLAGDPVCPVEEVRALGARDQHRRRRGHARQHRSAGAADRQGDPLSAIPITNGR